MTLDALELVMVFVVHFVLSTKHESEHGTFVSQNRFRKHGLKKLNGKVLHID